MFDLPYDLVPVKFHPYTSRTKNRVFETDYGCPNEVVQAIQRLKLYLIQKFAAAGIRAIDDNKVVFECLLSNGQRVCYGFYDGNFSIGLFYEDENER